MNDRSKRLKGFMIIEVQVMTLILAVTFVAFLAILMQSLKVSTQAIDSMIAESKFDQIYFELEQGLRPDIARFGSLQSDVDGYLYEIDVVNQSDAITLMDMAISWNGGRSNISHRSIVMQAPVQ